MHLPGLGAIVVSLDNAGLKSPTVNTRSRACLPTQSGSHWATRYTFPDSRISHAGRRHWTTYLSLLSRAGMVPHRVGVIPTLLGGLFHLLPQCPLKSRQLTGDAQGAAACPQSFCLMLYHSLTSTGLRNPSFSSPSWDPSTCRIQLVVFPRHPSLPSPEARTSWQRDCSSLNQDL